MSANPTTRVWFGSNHCRPQAWRGRYFQLYQFPHHTTITVAEGAVAREVTNIDVIWSKKKKERPYAAMQGA